MMEKIRHGVLAVQTETGVRLIRPSLLQRIRLIWTFRHFQVLPDKVLSRYETELIHDLLANGRFVVPGNGNGDGDCRIGTVERSAPLPPSKPAQAVPASGAAFSRAR